MENQNNSNELKRGRLGNLSFYLGNIAGMISRKDILEELDRLGVSKDQIDKFKNCLHDFSAQILSRSPR